MPHVPPPLVALAGIAAQQLLTTPATSSRPRNVVAGAVFLTAGALAGGAASRFRRGGTTVDPIHPDRASALVTDGPNAITRNPMYVGMTGVLLSNAVRRGSLTSLVPVAAFVAWIDRLQVAPEEAALRAKFGEEYAAYCATVPRWLDRRSLDALQA